MEQTGFSAPLALTGFIVLFALAGALVLWGESPEPSRVGRRLRQLVYWSTGRRDLAWVDLPLLVTIATVGIASAAVVTWLGGDYHCTAAGPPDVLTLVTSGQAFLHGGDPFLITACGHSGNPVPAGLASVLLDAVGSLAGPAGILTVWGLVSVGLLVLVWVLGGGGRRASTVFVLTSFLYLPIVAAQVDGATLAIVPVTVLLAVYLGRRRPWLGAGVGGFLATGRFPAIFPVVSAAGRAGARRWGVSCLGIGAFAAVSVATFAAYGDQFTGPVFLLQFSRANYALNYWGVVEGAGWLRPSTALTVVQAALTVALMGYAWVAARTDLGAVSLVLTGTLLLGQYLSFTELVFLVPVALLGHRFRFWLWAIGVVAATNYLLALRSLIDVGGPRILSYGLDLLLTALLLGLVVDVLRSEFRGPGPIGPAGGLPDGQAGAPGASARPSANPRPGAE